MIIKITNYIEKEICNTESEKNCTQLSALHLDVYKPNTELAMLFVFDGRTPFPTYVVRYSKSRDYDKYLYDEFTNYSLLYNKLSSRLRSHMPRPICTYDKASTLAIIEKGVPGESIASLIRHNTGSKGTIGYLKAAFDFLVAFQSETKQHSSSNDCRNQEFIDQPLSLFLDTFHIPSHQRRIIERIRDDVVDYLTEKSILVSCHGDYWPKNILAHNNKVYIIDWTFCREEYLLFWDYCTLMYSTRFKSTKMNYEFDQLKRDYLRKIDIYPDIESMVRLIYLAIRSVWNKHWHGIDGEWDYQWKVEFDKELSKFKL